VYGSAATNQSGETAKTLILIGLILQIIEVVVLLAIGTIFLIVPLLGGIVLVLGGLGIVWLLLVYLYSYVPTGAGDYRSAQTPTLVFAILSLITIGLISGILYIIAYVKLGDALTDAQRLGAPGGAPFGFPGTKFCPRCGRPNAPTAGFCAGCGSPLV
jgi:hypothetical protein